MRTARAHRDAEPLAGPDRDVDAELGRRDEDGEGEQVGRGDGDGPPGLGVGDDGREVAHPARGPGVLHEQPEHVPDAIERLGSVEVDDGQLDPERDGAGAQDGQGLRQHVGVDREDGALGCLGGAPGERHGLGGGGALVQERGVRDVEAGEVGDRGLEVQEGLEPALGDLRLVRRVRRVPGGVLQHVAPHHGRGAGAVVAHADEGGDDAVAAGEGAQRGRHRRLVEGLGQVQHPVADARGDGAVDELVEGGQAHDVEHAGHGGASGPMCRALNGRAAGSGVNCGSSRSTGTDGEVMDAPEVWRCADGPPRLSHAADGTFQSGLPHVVLPPERFRGCCPFGAPARIGSESLPHGVNGRGQSTGSRAEVPVGDGAGRRTGRLGPSALGCAA